MNNMLDHTEDVKRLQVSVLFGKQVMWIELILLAVLIYYHVVPLVVFVIFMLSMNLIVMLWKKYALAQLIPCVKLERSRVFAQEKVELTAKIFNNKYLPLTWLEWESEPLHGITWPGQGSIYRMRLLWILWKQEAIWSITVQAERRGVYPLGKIILRSGDGFRFTEEEQNVNMHKYLYVYPPVVPVKPPSLTTSVRWAMQGRNGGLLEDPLLVQGIRDYQPGDEWRRVSWQASARTGMLQTKVYQPIRLQSASLYIDVTGFDHLEQQDLFERLVSIVGSIALAYSEQGISVGFASNGVNHEGVAVQSILPSRWIAAVMDELAGLMPRCAGELPFSLPGNVPLFFFCDQIRMSHVKWTKQLRGNSTVYFYTCKESREEAFITGCSIQRVDRLLNAKVG